MRFNKNFKVLYAFLVMALVFGSSVTYAGADVPGNNNPTVYYVSPGGNDTNDGLTDSTSKKTIQNAIDGATNEAKIVIKSGTYKENLNVTKNVTLTSSQPQKTVIDGQGNGSCITILKDCHVTVNGLTITNGKATKLKTLPEAMNGYSHGGGINNEGYLTVMNSVIIGNTAADGGGISSYGSLFVENCTITKNTAEGFSGGININGFGKIIHCTITKNIANHGGGVATGGETILEYCTIQDNTAEKNGGGVYSDSHYEHVLIDHCEIRHNAASDGGGMFSNVPRANKYPEHILVYVNNSVISSNRAYDGGGLTNHGYICLINTDIVANGAIFGGGINNDRDFAHLWLYNCKVRGNIACMAGGIYNEGLDNPLSAHVYADNKTSIMFNIPYASNGKWVEDI